MKHAVSLFRFSAAVWLFALGLLSVAVGVARAAPTYTTLYNFSPVSMTFPCPNADGDDPQGLVEGRDGNFYGTTTFGGANGQGTIFKITPAGTLVTLYTFPAIFGSIGGGIQPSAPLIQGTDGNFYGTTAGSVASDESIVFKITPAGVYTTLHYLSYSEGALVDNALVEGADGNFYGTAWYGGDSYNGTIFKITPSGVFTRLYSFSRFNDNTLINYDGAVPFTLVLGKDGNLYGSTGQGGTYGYGTVVKITTAGDLTVIHEFTGGNDGSGASQLVAGSDGNIYGFSDGINGSSTGVIFKITPSGTFTNVVEGRFYDLFGLGNDGNLYGTMAGGTYGLGALFTITPTGTLTTLLNFDGAKDSDLNNLIQASDGNFYGTTGTFAGGTFGTSGQGGTNGTGSVIEIALNAPAPPTITGFSPASGPAGTTVTITGTNLTGATLLGFRAKHATSFTVSSDGTQITTTVPVGADTGQIAVLTPGGEAKSAMNFTVIKPVITGFTPTSGPVGTSVTITGTNLTGTTLVGFQGKHATSFTVNAAGTQITTTVPAGAQTGPVAVLTNGVEAKSSASYTVTP